MDDSNGDERRRSKRKRDGEETVRSRVTKKKRSSTFTPEARIASTTPRTRGQPPLFTVQALSQEEREARVSLLHISRVVIVPGPFHNIYGIRRRVDGSGGKRGRVSKGFQHNRRLKLLLLIRLSLQQLLNVTKVTMELTGR